jgi:hypothetical protein
MGFSPSIGSYFGVSVFLFGRIEQFQHGKQAAALARDARPRAGA